MSKKKYELNVELRDIPTEDLVKMVRDCWYIGEIDILCLLVFHDNDAVFFNRNYEEPYDVLLDVCHSRYKVADRYVKVMDNVLVSYSEEEARKELMENINEVISGYGEYLSLNNDGEYKHLFKEIK